MLSYSFAPHPDGIDPTELRRTFSGFPSGVAAIAAFVDDEPTVLIASSFTVGVSQDPPLVLGAVQHTSSTWPRLATAKTLGVSVLGDAHAPVARQLADKDPRRRFADIETAATETGSILLKGAPVWLDCRIEHTYPAGDHDIVVLRVLGLDSRFEHSPLVWHRSGFSSLPH